MDILTKRKIGHDEAIEAARRLINSHFRNPDHARVSIPARPDYDDDLVLLAYIEQQRDRIKQRGSSLGGVTTPRMEGDNLAIVLCGRFENPDQENGETGWTPDAEAGCEEVLAAIRTHYETP